MFIAIVGNVIKSINIEPLNEVFSAHCLFSQLSGNFQGFYLVSNSAS